MEMAIVDGAELDRLINYLSDLKESNVHTVRFVVEGGIKVKVNSGMWSPPIGRIAVNGY